MLPSLGRMGGHMSTAHYLFGFRGRINRAKVWLYLLIAIGFGIVMGIVAALGFDLKPTVDSVMAQIHVHAHPGHIDWSKVVCPAMKGPLSYVAAALLAALYLVAVWINLAVYAKRLHDRNRSAWWLLLYVGLPAVLDVKIGTPGHGVFHAVAILIGLWVFIDLWCLRGTRGSNRYGVDPLADGPVFCEPGKPVYGCTPKT